MTATTEILRVVYTDAHKVVADMPEGVNVRALYDVLELHADGSEEINEDAAGILWALGCAMVEDEWDHICDVPGSRRVERVAAAATAAEDKPGIVNTGEWVRMDARYAGKCAKCGAKFPKGTEILYSFRTKQAEHANGCASGTNYYILNKATDEYECELCGSTTSFHRCNGVKQVARMSQGPDYRLNTYTDEYDCMRCGRSERRCVCGI